MYECILDCVYSRTAGNARQIFARALSFIHTQRQAPSSNLANLGSGAPSASVSSLARLTPVTSLGSSSTSISFMEPSLKRTNAGGRVEEMSAQHALVVIATHAETRGRASPWKKTSPSCRCQSSCPSDHALIQWSSNVTCPGHAQPTFRY